MKGALDPSDPHFVSAKARDSVCGFLSGVVPMLEESSFLCGFGMVTQVQAYFPELITFLNECVVPDVACRDAEVNIEAFMFHLKALKVSFIIIFFVFFDWVCFS